MSKLKFLIPCHVESLLIFIFYYIFNVESGCCAFFEKIYANLSIIRTCG